MKIQSNNYTSNIFLNAKNYPKSKASSISFSASNNEDDYYFQTKLEHAKNRRKWQRQRCAALAGAAILSVSTALGAAIGTVLPEKEKKVEKVETEQVIMHSSESDSYEDIYPSFSEGNSQNSTSESITYSPEVDVVEEETKSIEETFAENPEVEEQYDKLVASLDKFSEQMGENALTLIQEKVDELGNGRVDVLDVLKILYIESNGRVYDENGEILKSKAGAYGPFQVTKDTEDFLNSYYGLTGTEKELDVENPYNNLEACIYNLRFLAAKRGEDIEAGKNLPTGDNLKTAVAWSYHDGAWATSISDRGESYIEKYETLSQVDDYQEVVDYILR